MNGRPKKPTRAQALAVITMHARNGDDRLAIRAYTENRISYAAFIAAFQTGKKQAIIP